MATRNNWCLRLLVVIATVVVMAGVTWADTSGSCSAAGSPAAEELRAKIDELEAKLSDTRREAGNLRFKAYELKKEVQKYSGEVNRSLEQRTELEETEKQCRKKLADAIGTLGGSNKENRLNRKAVVLCQGQKEKVEEDLKKVTAELEEARAGSCGGKASFPGGQDLESLREELGNCEETVKAVRDRCEKDSKELKRIGNTHERIRKGLEECREKASQCESEKDHLSFLKKGYDVVVQQLEKDNQEAKDTKEKSEANAKEAIKGVSRYRLYLSGIGVLALIGGTVKAYSFVKAKMAERLAALAAAKQKDKVEPRKKGLTPSARLKKKL